MQHLGFFAHIVGKLRLSTGASGTMNTLAPPPVIFVSNRRLLDLPSPFLIKSILIALILLLPALPALAADITVNASCSFADAWTAATGDTATGGCPAGSGADKIILTGDVTLSAGISYGGGGEITIEGNGHTISGNDTFRLFLFWGSPTLTLNSVTLTGGKAGGNHGGAIYAYNGSSTVNISDSVLRGNSAGGHGGAIHTSSSVTLNINRSAFFNNSALESMSYGGAIRADGDVTITKSSFYNNRATGVGGAIFLFPTGGKSASLRHVTVTGNTASQGGGLYSSGGNIELRNSIVYDNTANIGADCGRDTTSAPATLDVNSGNIIGASNCGGTTHSTDDPLLPAIGDGTTFIPLVPAHGSPAIDAVDCLAEVMVDFRETSRHLGATCDIGAYEVAPPPPPTPTPRPTKKPTPKPTRIPRPTACPAPPGGQRTYGLIGSADWRGHFARLGIQAQTNQAEWAAGAASVSGINFCFWDYECSNDWHWTYGSYHAAHGHVYNAPGVKPPEAVDRGGDKFNLCYSVWEDSCASAEAWEFGWESGKQIYDKWLYWREARARGC